MTGQPRVLIVADDLTGAMDSAGPFAARGVETWVVALPLRCDPASLNAASVVSVNTDSRHATPTQAAARLTQIVRHLDCASFDLVIKKIDSTLRGNVVAETMALRELSGRQKTLVAAAFPAQGRTVCGGVVHVEGQPLAQTAFARDALSPPPLVPLQEAFAGAQAGLRVGVVASGARFDDSNDIWIADSATDADLTHAVETFRSRFSSTLMVGSAGLTQALAAACFASRTVPLPAPRVAGTIVFAVGSRAARSADQVEALAALPDTRVLHAPNGRMSTGVIPAARNLVLQATADGVGREVQSERVAADMARHAIEIVAQARAQALVATGGDTAIAVLDASENPALQVCGDLLPGIPYARILLGGEPLWLITKAGGFGGRDTFCEVARRLRHH